MPQAGDVLLTYSGGSNAVASCVLQRLLFNSLLGPWFSHAAVALSRTIVIEAHTEPDPGETAWSGVTLGQGVRLRLIPDLLLSAKSWAVLRHPEATQAAAQFAIQTPHIALILGGGYTLGPLIQAARKASAAVAAVVPERWFDWHADPDTISTQLRENPQLRAAIEKHLPKGESLSSMSDYFCSELVGRLLWRGGLLERDPKLITPCGLFDLLSTSGWKDVTESDYGPLTQSDWHHTPRPEWQESFKLDTNQANWFRESQHVDPMLDHLNEKVATFSDGLDAIIGTLKQRYP